MDVICSPGTAAGFLPRISPPAYLPGRRLSRRFRPARLSRRRSVWLGCSAETLVAGASNAGSTSSRAAEEVDMKSWMHSMGLPPCKVELRERSAHDRKHRPIHYVVASEDLEVSCWDGVWRQISGLWSDLICLVLLCVGRRCGLLGSEFAGCDSGQSSWKRDNWYLLFEFFEQFFVFGELESVY